jgi:hypothetical protein
MILDKFSDSLLRESGLSRITTSLSFSPRRRGTYSKNHVASPPQPQTPFPLCRPRPIEEIRQIYCIRQNPTLALRRELSSIPTLGISRFAFFYHAREYIFRAFVLCPCTSGRSRLFVLEAGIVWCDGFSSSFSLRGLPAYVSLVEGSVVNRGNRWRPRPFLFTLALAKTWTAEGLPVCESPASGAPECRSFRGRGNLARGGLSSTSPVTRCPFPFPRHSSTSTRPLGSGTRPTKTKPTGGVAPEPTNE